MAIDQALRAASGPCIAVCRLARSITAFRCGNQTSPRKVSGFTLLEMIIVVAIVGILSAAAFPLADLVSHRAREAELRSALRQIRGAIDAYKQATDQKLIEKSVDESGYPKSLDDLVTGVEDSSKPDKPMIYLLRRLPRDPMHPDPTVPAAETWGLRSYASPPDAPSEGDDVFDVYSLSEKTGLNGLPYREW